MIGQDTIDRVRHETQLVSLIGESVKLEKRGRSHVGLCPFHKEKTPSFHVNEERGFYHCFGCQASGDAIKFVQEIEGVSFSEAIRHLAERVGIEVVETGSELERRREAEARRRRQELYEVGNIAAHFFQRMLTEHPTSRYALLELERRGLKIEDEPTSISEALESFRVGYAPLGWDSLARFLKTRGASHRAAEAVGLLVPKKSGSGHYDRFRHRLMFAVIDTQGRVVAFSGRSLEDPTSTELAQAGLEPSRKSSSERVAKYVNSPESPIYHKREILFGLYQAKQAIRNQSSSVLVEGNFDVVSLHAHGIKNVVAPLGTAFTVEQASQLKRFAPQVTILFDGDQAGRRAVRAARTPCTDAGLLATVATLQDGRDPDDMIRQAGPEGLQRILSAGRSMLEYLIETTLDRGFTADNAQARGAKIREVTELIAAERDPAVRAMAKRHADTIAERLGISDASTFRALASTVQRALSANPDTQRPASVEPPERARSRDQRRDIAPAIFGILLDLPALFEIEEVSQALQPVTGELAAAIAVLRQSHDLDVGEPVSEMLPKLPHDLREFASQRIAAPKHNDLSEAKSELINNINKLRKLASTRQKPEMVEELQRAAASGNFEQELDLLHEQVRRARERRGLSD